jgi:ribokinase
MADQNPDTIDALGIGVAVRDVAVLLDTFPEPNRKYQAKDMFETGGGPVPTALVTLSRLGRRVSFAGVVGDNAAGRFIVESLERDHVDTKAVVFREGFRSPTSVILVENDRRTILECWQYNLPLRFEELEPRGIHWRSVRFLLVDARLVEIQAEAARRVRNSGGRVVLDCGHPRPGVDELLSVTDIALFSYTYPKTLYGEDYDIAEFLAQLRSRQPKDGPRIAGLTLGSKGCALSSAETSWIRIPGHEVDALDSTGAGDVFHGAFVHEYMRSLNPETAARFANAAAALKCKGMTGRSPIPSEDEIRQLARRKTSNF